MRIAGSCLFILIVGITALPAQANLPQGRESRFEQAYSTELATPIKPKRAPDEILGTDCNGLSAWRDAGMGLSGSPQIVGIKYTVELNGELYALVLDQDHHLLRYNGRHWTYVSQFPVFASVTAMVVYNGDIYFGGAWRQPGSITGFDGIFKWNASGFEAFGSDIVGRVESLAVHDDKLFVAGDFGAPGVIERINVGSWDGERWEILSAGFSSSITHLLSHKGDLYVGGDFRSIGNEPIAHITRWDGETWHALGNSIDRPVRLMASYRDDLFVHAHGMERAGEVDVLGAAIWDGDSWRRAGGGIERFNNLGCWITKGDKLYVGGTVAGGSRLNAADQGIAEFDGSDWSVVGVMNGSPWDFTVFRGTLFVNGYFSEICKTKVNFLASLGDRDVYAVVSGTVFSDLDENCSYGAGDFSIGRSVIEVTPGPLYTSSNSDGSYSFYLQPGTYTIRNNQRGSWRKTCPVGSDSYTLTVVSADQEVADLDFGSQALGLVQELELSVVSTSFRIGPGTIARYLLRYENVGNHPFTGQLRVNYNSPLEYTRSFPAADRHIPNELTWDLAELPIGAADDVIISFVLPEDEGLIGQTVCVSATSTAEKVEDDELRIGDDESCREITNAVDPNDIQVRPAGIGPEGKITPDIYTLTYIVRFQNTGTAPASTVVVIDTLDHTLFDIGSLRIGAASHDFSFEISGSGILTWTFNNIMLPDSTADEAASHGVLKYKINLRPDLAVGTEIRNRAGIYFDFNKPVITNTARTTISSEATSVETSSLEQGIRIFPNPAANLTTIESEDLVPGTIVLRNALGQTLRSFACDGSPTARLSLSTVPNGSYYLELPTAGGTIAVRLIVVH